MKVQKTKGGYRQVRISPKVLVSDDHHQIRIHDNTGVYIDRHSGAKSGYFDHCSAYKPVSLDLIEAALAAWDEVRDT